MLRNGQGTRWAYRTAECPYCSEIAVELAQLIDMANSSVIGCQSDPAGLVALARHRMARRHVH
jgi:hypothetical protein